MKLFHKVLGASTFVTIAFSIFITVVITKNVSFLQILNSSFIISLLLLLAGIAISIIQNENFDRVIQSFKNFYKTIDRGSEYANQLERKKGQAKRSKFNPEYGRSILLSGTILISLSIIISMFFLRL